MIGFDIISLAGTIASGISLKKEEKQVIVERMVEAAVDCINTPHLRDRIIDPLIPIFEDEYGLSNPCAVILEYIDHINNEMKRHGWDERLKIKMNIQKKNGIIHKAIISMDLDTTLHVVTPVPVEEPLPITDIIETTPSLEQLNELFGMSQKKPKRSIKVLPNRQSRFVKDIDGRGWGSR